MVEFKTTIQKLKFYPVKFGQYSRMSDNLKDCSVNWLHVCRGKN